MGRARLFDHDECLRRHAAGASIASLASAYGVSHSAIYRIVTPGALDREARALATYYARRRVPCEGGCGKLVLSLEVSGRAAHNPDGRLLCTQCRGREKRQRFRFDDRGNLTAVCCVMLDCANGERWQSPENFTKGTRFHDLREGGIHNECRSCQTRARRIYRATHPEQREREKARERERKRRRRAAA